MVSWRIATTNSARKPPPPCSPTKRCTPIGPAPNSLQRSSPRRCAPSLKIQRQSSCGRKCQVDPRRHFKRRGLRPLRLLSEKARAVISPAENSTVPPISFHRAGGGKRRGLRAHFSNGVLDRHGEVWAGKLMAQETPLSL